MSGKTCRAITKQEYSQKKIDRPFAKGDAVWRSHDRVWFRASWHLG